MGNTDETRKQEFPDYESYSYGPIKLERIGRNIMISSNWQPEQFEQHIQRIKKIRPRFKNEIDQKVRKISTLIQKFDPLSLLATISTINCFGDPEEYRETTHKGAECYVEYAQSLLLSYKYKEYTEMLTKDIIEQFNNLIAEIFNAVLWYFASESTVSDSRPIEKELRYMSILRYLFIRGNSYVEQHIDMMISIFKEHDSFFKQHYGITSGEIIASVQCIAKQLNENMQQQSMIMQLLHELHELYKEFADKENIEKYASFDEYRQKYLSLPVVQKKKKKLDELSINIGRSSFEIIPSTKIPIELLKLLSSQFGCNKDFIEFPKSPGWPTNNTVIYDRPLIEHENKFYCFTPQILIRNIVNILEKWIKLKDINYFEGIYQKKRAKYLENKMMEYLSNILPGAKVYRNLYYYTYENGKKKRNETDGLILFDENIILAEGKAGGVPISARRGSIDSMRKNIKALIDDAYEQASRTKQYIMKTKEPVFEDEKGVEILIKDKEKYKNIYLINVTLQNLGQIATQLHLLKKLDFIKGKEWLWSVFINDLRIISELIEFPSVFLHFLTRRIKTNEYAQFRTIDELDLLMYYFKKGLYFGGNGLKDAKIQIPYGYTEELDRYYDFVAGRVSSGEKPQLDSPPEYKELVKKIEATHKLGFTLIGTTLLSLDRKVQQKVVDWLNSQRNQLNKDVTDHNFTMVFDDFGLTFYINKLKTSDLSTKLDDYAKSKIRKTKCNKWICIVVEYRKNGDYNVNFHVYNRTG
ncbi:hypothetical protein ES705_14424 [subsurface metagenome]